MRGAIARGVIAGAAAGACWAAVEWAANRTLGGLVPPRTATTLLALDAGIGAAAGLALAVALAVAGRRVGGAALALGLAAVYGLLRVFDPPGLGLEAAFVLCAASLAV